MDMEQHPSSCINLEPHDMQVVKKTWQTISYAQYQRLDHSAEKLVCKKCGQIIDPWEVEP